MTALQRLARIDILVRCVLTLVGHTLYRLYAMDMLICLRLRLHCAILPDIALERASCDSRRAALAYENDSVPENSQEASQGL